MSEFWRFFTFVVGLSACGHYLTQAVFTYNQLRNHESTLNTKLAPLFPVVLPFYAYYLSKHHDESLKERLTYALLVGFLGYTRTLPNTLDLYAMFKRRRPSSTDVEFFLYIFGLVHY